MSARHTSRDGLLSSSDPKTAALWDSLDRRTEAEKAAWTELLRGAGVKYAHPDDGWVRREEGRHTVSWYPQFNDMPLPGDLIAFGCPTSQEHYHSWGDLNGSNEPEAAAHGYRICRVISIEHTRGILGGSNTSITYEDTGDRLPPRAPEPPLRKKALAAFKLRRRKDKS